MSLPNATLAGTTNCNQLATQSITILGAGAIGQLIYHQLQAKPNPFEVNFISRDSDSASLALTLTNIEGEITTLNAQFIGCNDYQQALSKSALLIVCVKAYQVASALNSVLPFLSSNAHILLLHNGMGPHIDVISSLNGRGLSLGTTSQGSLKMAQWHIQQTGAGLTQLGSLNGDVKTPPLSPLLKNILLNSIKNSEWHADILPLLWQKLAVNVAINPLTAIHQCANGELAADKYRDIINCAVAELVEVAHADGINLSHAFLIERVYQVIALTANNLSSMHQDVCHQRKTEVNAINGFVVARGKALRIDTPYNQQLLKQIQQIEAKYLPPAPSSISQ
ncbi:ketopantoate reductase family protein [Shewanella sairae]|nr:2-dehydropantoate 2-reductase [Shewanella sairae]MCL1131100.1 2-dehydropantoate 2-reductase [Shewanella sairae]